MAIADLWSQRGILYQIHPHSFRDSNDDGIGDLQAIIERLPYLKSLGIHAVWQSPVFPSPIADFGDDVFDYTGLDPISIGTSGAMARPTAGRQTTGCSNSAAAWRHDEAAGQFYYHAFLAQPASSDLKSQLTNCRSSAT
jgi:hypothetical protein